MNLKKELPLIAIVLMPFIYLTYVWKQLPEKVPMHWNFKGEIDRYGNKGELILIPIFLPLLVYLIFIVIPKIDPKNKLKNMGNKFQTLKVLLTIFMSALAILIIYISKNQTLLNTNYLIIFIGVLYLVIGNYLKTIRANYFIGIRTPWTLESETVWKKTHSLGGKLIFGGGFLIIISSLIFEKQANFIIFSSITIFATVIPLFYSYYIFNKERSKEF